MLTVRKSQIHLMDKGSGEPVLFLHGNPDSSEIWSSVIQALSPYYRCIAPDLPGFGYSTVSKEFDFSLDGLAGFVDDLVETIGITQPLNLVVHDLGGPYGLAWAVKHPQKVKRLVIMNTVFFSDYRWHLLGRIWRTPIAGELFQLLTNRRGFAQELRRGSRKLTLEQINRIYDLISPQMKRMVLRLYRALDPNQFKGWEDQLLELTASVPSLVLWGDHDPYIAVRFAERFGAQWIEHFSESGHWIQAEEPEAVVNRMLSFFADANMPNNPLNPDAQKLHAG